MRSHAPEAFTCPTCAASFPISESTKAALVDHGCPLCAGPVPETAIGGA
ncbi:DUF7560 family zinc ribbon protein [Halovivax limisalsi]|nr:zinc ribbon domain-containing protein [Halovivax limisalsi]